MNSFWMRTYATRSSSCLVFIQTEISAIVTQRNYYEALIARPKQAECYLKYIEYEKRLEKLRRLRVGKYGEP
jgi:hypothetical protein